MRAVLQSWSQLRPARFRLLTSATAVAAALFFAGCAHSGTPAQRAEHTKAITRELAALHPSVDPDDAARLANAATERAAELAHEYRPARPAWFNNMLVNAGLRKRGLCYHWTNDLFRHLAPLNLPSLRLHLAVARHDTPREHNSVVVTAADQPFTEGLVLDAWRHGGQLHVVAVTNDTRYAWQPLPRSAMRPDLRELLDASSR